MLLEADRASRRRMAVVGGALALLLGGFAVSGVVQRVWPELMSPPAESQAADPVELARIRREASRMREQRKQIAAVAKSGRWPAVVAAADKMLAAGEGNRDLRWFRAEALLRQGDERAGAEMSQLLSGQDDPTVLGGALVLRGDMRGYRSLCARTVGAIRDPEKAEPNDANNAAWVAALGPGGLDDYGPALALAESAVRRAPTPDDRWTFLNTLGAVQLRAGRDADAIRSLEEAERLRPDPFNWPFLALAYARQGDTARAVQFRDKLRKELDATFATNRGVGLRHELLMFWREVEDAVPNAGPKAGTPPPSK
jgi:tetratricopeptide (TPR) repeat protein